MRFPELMKEQVALKPKPDSKVHAPSTTPTLLPLTPNRKVVGACMQSGVCVCHMAENREEGGVKKTVPSYSTPRTPAYLPISPLHLQNNYHL